MEKPWYVPYYPAVNKSAPIIGLWLLASYGAFAGEAITQKNWASHPEVVEARSLYQKINDAKKEGNLKKKERKYDTAFCEPYEDDARILFTEQNGKARIYYYEGGSADSMVRRELFYDESGRLRFAFIRASAYNGTKLEHRVYFSKAGIKIWEIQKLLEGPGYTFPTEWPDAELIRDPVQAFNEKSPCPETISVAPPLHVKVFEKEASQLFDKQFREGRIEGTGHIFGIVVACDSKRLNEIAGHLSKDQMSVLEYDFTFKVNTVLKSLAAIIGANLKESVEQCIIDKYYQDVTFASGSWMRPVIENKIRFSAVMVSGREPMFPRTPIGFVTHGK